MEEKRIAVVFEYVSSKVTDPGYNATKMVLLKMFRNKFPFLNVFIGNSRININEYFQHKNRFLALGAMDFPTIQVNIPVVPVPDDLQEEDLQRSLLAIKAVKSSGSLNQIESLALKRFKTDLMIKDWKQRNFFDQLSRIEQSITAGRQETSQQFNLFNARMNTLETKMSLKISNAILLVGNRDGPIVQFPQKLDGPEAGNSYGNGWIRSAELISWNPSLCNDFIRFYRSEFPGNITTNDSINLKRKAISKFLNVISDFEMQD